MVVCIQRDQINTHVLQEWVVSCYGTIHTHICTSLYDGVRHQVYIKYMYTHKTMFGVVENVNSRLIQTFKHHNTYSPPSYHIPFSTLHFSEYPCVPITDTKLWTVLMSLVAATDTRLASHLLQSFQTAMASSTDKESNPLSSAITRRQEKQQVKMWVDVMYMLYVQNTNNSLASLKEHEKS